MIIAGLLGMATKFTECTLGVRYRNEYENGTVSGGPLYYLSKGLSEDGRAGLGKFLAIFFSICCVGGALGGGNMFQANQSFVQISGIIPFFEGKGWLFGLIMAAVVGVAPAQPAVAAPAAGGDGAAGRDDERYRQASGGPK